MWVQVGKWLLLLSTPPTRGPRHPGLVAKPIGALAIGEVATPNLAKRQN
jgi:hypothetical protein